MISASEPNWGDFDRKNLFTTRYNKLNPEYNGESSKDITKEINILDKENLCTIMYEFAQPMKVKKNRYDDKMVETNALEHAIAQCNKIIGYPTIDINSYYGPERRENILANCFTPYLFDLIELQYFVLSNLEKPIFMQKINQSFKDDDILFELSKDGMINKVHEDKVFDNRVEEMTKEPGLKELIKEARILHEKEDSLSHKHATEKMWDALERLKTYYTEKDKLNSVNKIIENMSNGQDEFKRIFDEEFKSLTKIGNEFTIRHHETNKISITDERYYDYFLIVAYL